MKVNSRLSIVPSKNLIQNIGFGDEATHTFDTSFVNPPIYEIIKTKLTGPLFVVPDKSFSKLQAFKKIHLFKRIFNKLAKLKVVNK